MHVKNYRAPRPLGETSDIIVNDLRQVLIESGFIEKIGAHWDNANINFGV